MFLLISCSSDTSTQIESDQSIGVIPTLSSTAMPGKSAIVGQVVSIAGQQPQPLPNTEVRIASVIWNEDKTDGAFVIDEASNPTFITDDLGGFVFTDIEPQDYVIVVGELYGQNVILSKPDGTARIFTLTADNILNVGTLQVDLNLAPDYSLTPDVPTLVAPAYPVPNEQSGDNDSYP